VQSARVDGPSHNRLAADEAQSDTALATPLGLLGQDGVGAGTHEVEIPNVDHERTWRYGDGGASAYQAPPGGFVAGVDVTADVNYHC
jgi:hypothetical protein